MFVLSTTTLQLLMHIPSSWFEVNKSAASGILHRAEGQIIKEFIAETAV